MMFGNTPDRTILGVIFMSFLVIPVWAWTPEIWLQTIINDLFSNSNNNATK